MRTPLFYDSEFTGLTQDTSLISLCLMDLDSRVFYAEFSDYKRSQVDEFVNDNVLAHTLWLSGQTEPEKTEQKFDNNTLCVLGDSSYVRKRLLEWLEAYQAVEVWADHVAYDWVLFCQLFGGALSLPNSVHYIPRDLCSFLICQGVDPEINRLEYSGGSMGEVSSLFGSEQHNAYFDALVLRACYSKLLTGKF